MCTCVQETELHVDLQVDSKSVENYIKASRSYAQTVLNVMIPGKHC